MNSVILKPLITEKSIKNVSKNKFSFVVSGDSNKNQIKKEIEEKFKVNVVSVSTNILKGRKKRHGTKRIETKESSFKRAIVELKAGQKIDLFDFAQS